MPGFNGQGVYQRYYSWTQDAASGIPITASRMDTDSNGFATGLSTCITKDGQTTVTADIPFNNNRLLLVADPEGATDAANFQTITANESLSVAGSSDVTLTTEQSLHNFLTFTGTLTGNISVIFPTTQKLWMVRNNTAGSFTLTCKVTGQTGVLVTQGDTQALYGSGTDIEAASPALTSDGAVQVRAGGSLGNIYANVRMQFGGRVGDGGVNTSNTSATTIGAITGRGMFAVVAGRDQLGIGSKFFTDIVLLGTGPMGPSAVAALDGGSGAAARNYTISGTDLKIAMAATDGGYEIALAFLSANRS